MRRTVITVSALLLLAACQKPVEQEAAAPGGDSTPPPQTLAQTPDLAGKPAPTLLVENSYNWKGGDTPGLKDFEGKVVVLDFWTYW